MKYIVYFICITILLFSCSYKNELHKAESIRNTIDYSEGFLICESKINEVLNIYKSASQKNRHSWNGGYSQQCNYIRYLYFIHNFFTWEQFIQKELDVYEQWFSENSNDKNHLFYYGLLLLVTEREKGKEVLSEIYNPMFEYTFEASADITEIKNFFSGLLLDRLPKEKFEGTVYEEFFDYSLEEIVGIIIE